MKVRGCVNGVVKESIKGNPTPTDIHNYIGWRSGGR
jgi:hypothetical protein